MKVKTSILMISGLAILFRCSSPTDTDHSDGPVTLEIYSPSYTSGMIDQISVEENQDITVDFGDYSTYRLLAKREGYFTGFYQCSQYDVINISLDPIDYFNYSGILYKAPNGIPISVFSNRTVTICQNGEIVSTFTTDDYGRFSIQKMKYGVYSLSTSSLNLKFWTPLIINNNYQDILIEDYEEYIGVKKPNIYLYPEEDSHIALSLEFPNGGSVTESIPAYVGGWDVDVTTEGKIDGQYDYLFYECDVPDYCQYTFGWVVQKDGLRDFFESNMQAYGFNEKEIGDFTEYWISRLTQYENYIIYPQLQEEIAKMILIRSSKAIDSEGRLFYNIKGTNYNGIQLTAPDIVPFNRDGFTLMEWGVILK